MEKGDEMSRAILAVKGEDKTDSLSKQDALIQICSLLQQIPCETLTLICDEAGTNAHSTVSSTPHTLTQTEKYLPPFFLFMSANSFCFCLIS